MKTSARVRVRLLVDVDVGDAWGGDCPLSQVRKQGGEAALGIMRRALEGGTTERERVRVVDVSACEMVIEDRK